MNNLNKEDILKIARDERNREYESEIEVKALRTSMYGIIVLCLFFGFTKPVFSYLAKSKQSIPFSDLPAIFFGFLAINYFIVYRKNNNKKHLRISVFSGIAFVFYTVLYLISMYYFYLR